MHSTRRTFGATVNHLFSTIVTNTMLAFLGTLSVLPDLRNIDEPHHLWVERLGQQSLIFLELIIKFMILKSFVQMRSIDSSLISPSP